MKWILSSLLFISSLGFAESEKEIIERYRLRYKDFFARLQEEERRNQQRLSGRLEIREERQQRFEILERARKRFVASKPPPKDMTRAYQIHLEEEAAQKREYLKIQERYSRMQREVEKAKEGAIKIPPILEYGLENQL